MPHSEYDPPSNGISEDLKIEGIDSSQAIGFDKRINETLIEEIKTESKTPFKRAFTNTINKDILVWAMVIGLKNKNRKKILSKDIGKNVPLPTFENNLFSYWIARALSLVEENDYEVLIDMTKIRDIVQEYVNGGISLFHNRICGEDNQINELKNLVLEHLDTAKNAIDSLEEEGFIPKEIISEE